MIRSTTNAMRRLARLLTGLCFFAAPLTARAQVSPAEITNPQLKAAETDYYPQIMALYRAINDLKPPFPLRLSRYVGLDPTPNVEADSRGVEFVHFQDRLLLKISATYNAAYSAERLTQNQRASRTFSEVIAPILSLVAIFIPEDVACDGVGFEIAYHVRAASHNFDYEGKEMLVVVLDRADAFAFAGAGSDSKRQEILNRSQIYLDGKEFGLALGQQEALDPEAMGKTISPRTDPTPAAADPAAGYRGSPTLVSPKLLPPRPKSTIEPDLPAALPGQSTMAGTPATPAVTAGDRPTPATAADAEHLQSQFQAQLDALTTTGQAKFHFVDYAPPSFVIYRDQVVLQMTLRNTLHFPSDSGSIYKRAARSFDLFLATELKDLLDKVPADAPFDAYDITVLNQLGTEPRGSSEAVEFVCPRSVLRQFVNADITNQQLVDKSIVLVNGVRIALNLQLVE
jgi:hypothetical protein